MKTAIYIEDGIVQLVLTPESKFEQSAISGFTDKPLTVQIFDGSFYDCRGGWVMQTAYRQQSTMYGSGNHSDRSIILRVDTREPAAIVAQSNSEIFSS